MNPTFLLLVGSLTIFATGITYSSATCPTSHLSCDYGSRCYPKGFRCDGDFDCIDGSDEAGCPPRPPRVTSGGCSAEQIPCAIYDQCINKEKVCDGRKDCIDGTDEVGCRKPPHRRQTPMTSGRAKREIQGFLGSKFLNKH